MNAEIFIPITLFVSAALMIVTIAYYRSRESLAMIERGMNPKENKGGPVPYRTLKWGLLMVGAGSGLLMAYLLDELLINAHDTEAIYFSLIAIGGGLGLLASFRAEKDWMEKNPERFPES
jgi:choline-glycine betaine transporter